MDENFGASPATARLNAPFLDEFAELGRPRLLIEREILHATERISFSSLMPSLR